MARSAAHFIPLDQIAIVHVSDHLLYPSALDSFVQRKEMTGQRLGRRSFKDTWRKDHLRGPTVEYLSLHHIKI